MPNQPRLIAEPTPEYDAEAERARREAYLDRLREYLRDPDFRAIEGFPIGEDEDILALSDPPYYTACPNPFLAEILEQWQAERAALREELGLPDDSDDNGGDPVYHREPFATDVSEGKSGAIYTAHSYHTKVPHKAVMRYILHYTEPGDVVFDGFCGTGMTGVAAQLCGDRKAVQGLGYRVTKDGTIYDGDEAISRLSARRAVLVDLSPAATFIAYNYNLPVEAGAFEREAERILQEVQDELGWMYETWHTPGDEDCVEVGGARYGSPVQRVEKENETRIKARISYTVWSEVFVCPQCSGEVVFYEEALDGEGHVKSTFECPHCGTAVTKNSLDKYYVTQYDPLLKRSVKTLKRVPVMIEYKVGQTKYHKKPDAHDLKLLERIANLPNPEVPTNALPIEEMYHGSRLAPKGVTHVYQLFFPRARHALSTLWSKAAQIEDARLRAFMFFTVEQAIWTMSKLNRYRPTGYSQVNQYLTGVYYISSQISEVSPWYVLRGKVKRLARAFTRFQTQTGNVAIATQSAGKPPALENTIDYIFTDPPFGENIYYADLNYLVESWHRVWTESKPEAIVDQAKEKTLRDYQELMRAAFVQYYRWLKPGRWMTVEFHNSYNAVWNAIQEALLSAGFMIADVRTLDKQSKSYRQVTAASAAKQDLVISAYKPRTGFEERFAREAGTPQGAWDFVRQHLDQLPIVVRTDGQLEALAERQDYLLFDRMVAFHIQRGATVPLSAPEFYAGLRQRFIERDNMFFLPHQVVDYDRARLQAESVAQLSLFVSDEKSAIQWLRQQLDPKTGGQPQTYQDLQPQFLQQLHQAGHEALPELQEILEQNFLEDDAGRWYVPDPHKAGDLEQLRRKTLLREFKRYAKETGRLRKFRTEAVRAGFADAWQRQAYETIIQVAERLDESVLQEDPELLMYYDNAALRLEEE